METKKEYEIYMCNSAEETEFKIWIKTKDFSEVKTLALLAAEIFANVYVELKNSGEIIMAISDYSEEENDI